MIKCFSHKGEVITIRVPSSKELVAIGTKSIIEQYKWYLSLMITKSKRINQYTGKVNELQSLVEKIKEAAK